MIIMYSIPKTGTSTVEYSARITPSFKTIILNRENFSESLHSIVSNNEQYDLISRHRISSSLVTSISKDRHNVITMTLWREPAPQIVSAYHYDLDYKYKFHIPFFLWYHFLIPKNPQSSHLCRRYASRFVKSLYLSEKDLNFIRSVLTTFDYVIPTEQIDDIIPAIFRNHFSLDEEFTLVRRKTTGRDYMRRIDLSADLRARLNRENMLDYLIHKEFIDKVSAI